MRLHPKPQAGQTAQLVLEGTGLPAVEPRYHDPVLGIVFDLDGTLVLSHHDFGRMRGDVIRLAESRGVPRERLATDLPTPKLFQQAIHELQRLGASVSDLDRFEAEVNRRLDEIELEALPSTLPRSGVVGLLELLAGRGFRLGVLTRSSAAFAEQALHRAGIRKFFVHVRTRSDPGPSKPDPDALRIVLRQMEVPPQRAVFVGDHLLDGECASRAGVRFYAVLPTEASSLGTDLERFRAAGATAIASDLETLGRQLTGNPTAEIAQG